MKSTEQKIAIVSGASRGIGLSIVQNLAEQGFSIGACIRSKTEEIVELIESGNGRHRIFNIDLSDDNSITSCARDLLSWTKNPDVLVNCAGAAIGGLFTMTKLSDVRKIYDVNLFRTLLLTQYIAKKNDA